MGNGHMMKTTFPAPSSAGSQQTDQPSFRAGIDLRWQSPCMIEIACSCTFCDVVVPRDLDLSLGMLMLCCFRVCGRWT